MRNGPQLITYPDSLGGSLSAMHELLEGPLVGMFPSGVHVLPPFPSSGDRGFAPIRYDMVDPAFGTIDDLVAISKHGGLTLDVMVNHISAQSPQYLDFLANGRASSSADLFLTVDKVFPNGGPRSEDLASTALRRADGPLIQVPIGESGRTETIWATFGDKSTGRVEQIDLDLNSRATRALIARWFGELRAMGATTVRLDAVGYVTKRAGTSSFMIEPDIWDHMSWLSAAAAEHGMDVLPEVHHVRSAHHGMVAHGYRSYDFVLPAMVLHALETGSAADLCDHLSQSPDGQVTTIDTHDGIPIMPDLDGVLPAPALERVVAACMARGANLSRVFNPKPGAVETHQINITYRDAVRDDSAYLAARAIQLFAPGIAQIYYVGLLGGRNDEALYAETGDGRSVNRHNYTEPEVTSALADPVVQKFIEWIRFRGAHPAFGGSADYRSDGAVLHATWTDGGHRARLTVDMSDSSVAIEAT